MISQSVAADMLTAALSLGGDFAEIFVEKNVKNSVNLVNGVVEKAQSGIDAGAGIRIFSGFNAVYAYTCDLSRENLIKVAKEASAAVKDGAKAGVEGFTPLNTPQTHLYKLLFDKIGKKRIVDMLMAGHSAAKQYSPSISQTNIMYMDSVQDVLIANSQGLWAEDRRARTRSSVNAVASSETEKQTGSVFPGALMGFEFYDGIDFTALGREAARIADTMLKAGLCPGGKMPVIIDNGFGGVIFHEACGHSLEATSVAKNASVFANRLGEQIASPLVTAIDDGTVPNMWGSLNIDDEGTKTQHNVLIENGILKSYLIDKLNGRKMGMASTGSGRRESYRFAPTSRMNNTYIEAGKERPEDIIADTEFALYAKEMGGGSVNPGTGEFNFSVLEGYMVRNGKIAEPVRGASLIGKGEEILRNIDRVGSNIDHGQGMCGSMSGSVPTNVGQPMIRVSEITVGGRG